MDVREKLVDIVCDATQINGCIHSCNHPPCAMVRGIVDALIANGVTVQECKLGVKKTNADRIRSMSDEELAMCLYEIGYYRGWNALEGTLEWLQQPAEEADNETVEDQKDGDGNG